MAVGFGLLMGVVACGGASEADPTIVEGRQIFTQVAQPTCATCHTLSDAGATGQIGPDLDALKPNRERVAAAVTNGLGVMPAQRGILTPEQIEAVSVYVAEATGASD